MFRECRVIEAFLSRALLVAIRVGGLMTFAPFFGNAALPNQVKAGLTLILTVLLLPVYASAAAPAAQSIGQWTVMALGEAAIGLMTGFTTQFVFDGMELAGQIIGFQFGFSLVNIIDPNTKVQTTVLGSFHELFALLAFMELGIQRWLLRATAASFRMIPVGGLAASRLPAAELLRMGGAMWLIGAEIAFPVVLATMLTDVTVGFVSKASPQFPAMFFGISAKVLVGLAVLFGAVAFWPDALAHYFYHALADLERLLSIAR
jgi:flagellar biosynthesis protein FliR